MDNINTLMAFAEEKLRPHNQQASCIIKPPITCLALHALSGVFCDDKNIIKMFFNSEAEQTWQAEVDFYKMAQSNRIPVPQLLEASSDNNDSHFFLISEKSKGFMLQDILPMLSEQNRISLFHELKDLLATLHKVPTPCHNSYSTWLSSLAYNTARGLLLLRDRGFLSASNNLTPQVAPSYDHLSHIFVKHFSYLSKNNSGNLSFIHGDFCEKNIFVYEKNNRWIVESIIDFGFSGLSDPLFDFVRGNQMASRLHPQGQLFSKKEKESLLAFYEICDYIIHIKNTIAINDSGVFPYFNGKSFQYPDCHPDYISAQLSTFPHKLMNLSIL